MSKTMESDANSIRWAQVSTLKLVALLSELGDQTLPLEGIEDVSQFA